MMVDGFMAGVDHEESADRTRGVDELHMVYTEFRSMLTQQPVAKRVAPLEVEYTEETAEQLPDYEFEPDAGELLGALLPKYVKDPLVRRAARVGGVRVGLPAAGDEGGDRQRRTN